MMDWCELDPLRQRLNAHPVYGSVKTLTDLQVAMPHQIYPAWDHMSRVKSIQGAMVPAFHPCRNRTIHRDEDFHGLLSLRLLEEPVRMTPNGSRRHGMPPAGSR
jgi:Protein of unknown function (DUF3050)